MDFLGHLRLRYKCRLEGLVDDFQLQAFGFGDLTGAAASRLNRLTAERHNGQCRGLPLEASQRVTESRHVLANAFLGLQPLTPTPPSEDTALAS